MQLKVNHFAHILTAGGCGNISSSSVDRKRDKAIKSKIYNKIDDFYCMRYDLRLSVIMRLIATICIFSAFTTINQVREKKQCTVRHEPIYLDKV